MILTLDRFHFVVAVIILLSSTSLFCSAAVISENAKGKQSGALDSEPRTIMMATMSRLMEYFRNADIFASIRTMLDSGSGVKKEWVPLGSLMFSRPLGQKTS